MPVSTSNIPTNFVAFGATGDLMRRKVIPSLHYLHTRGSLPERFQVIGFSRRDWSDTEFRSYIREVVEEHTGVSMPDENIQPFLELFHFQKGTFNDAKSYRTLKDSFNETDKKWGLCSSKLFYLAVAPEYYEGILKNLSDSELTAPCDPGEGWTHVIVEKPFGVDLKTAKGIDELLGKLFQEQQIYRIDHYLAKEMLQNILAFRFANNLFEMHWDNSLIERIHLKLLERIGVEKRGPFYDGVGALRDVGQNHLLQMLALVTMEHPLNLEAASVQKKRAEILQELEVLSEKEAKQAT